MSLRVYLFFIFTEKTAATIEGCMGGRLPAHAAPRPPGPGAARSFLAGGDDHAAPPRTGRQPGLDGVRPQPADQALEDGQVHAADDLGMGVAGDLSAIDATLE